MVKARPSNKNREARFLHFDTRQNGMTACHVAPHLDVVSFLVGICRSVGVDFNHGIHGRHGNYSVRIKCIKYV